jgi:hypothetical protein
MDAGYGDCLVGVRQERLLPEPSKSIQVNSETIDACDSPSSNERGDPLSCEDAAVVGVALDVKLAVDSSLSRSFFIRSTFLDC